MSISKGVKLSKVLFLNSGIFGIFNNPNPVATLPISKSEIVQNLYVCS